MKEHYEPWLGAYLDGELTEIQIIALENHLNECETCQQNYQQHLLLRQNLAVLKPFSGTKAPDQFLSEIKLQMRDQPAKKLGIKKISWYLFPAALLLFLGVMQVFGWMTGLIALIPGANRLIFESLPFLTSSIEMNPWLTTVLQTGLFWNGLDWFLDWNIFTQIILLLGTSILYCAWMALWMMNHSPQSKQI